MLDPGGQRSKDIVIIDEERKLNQAHFGYSDRTKYPGRSESPCFLSFLLVTLAHDKLCSNSNSNFHGFFICSSGIIRLGFVSSHSLALQVRIYRISCCRVIRSWWYPPSSQGSNVSLLGVDTQSGISKNPARPTITVQAHFAARGLRL